MILVLARVVLVFVAWALASDEAVRWVRVSCERAPAFVGLLVLVTAAMWAGGGDE